MAWQDVGRGVPPNADCGEGVVLESPKGPLEAFGGYLSYLREQGNSIQRPECIETT